MDEQAHDREEWRTVLRFLSVVGFLICAGVVIWHIADRLHWRWPLPFRIGFRIGFPAIGAGWGFVRKWKNRLVDGLCVAAFTPMAAALIIVGSGADLFPLEEGLAGLSLALLFVAISTHAVLSFIGWRRDRRRLRKEYPNPLQRSSGGF